MKHDRVKFVFLFALFVVFTARCEEPVAESSDSVQINDDGRIVHWRSHEDGYCVADGDGFCDPIPTDVIEALCK